MYPSRTPSSLAPPSTQHSPSPFRGIPASFPAESAGFTFPQEESVVHSSPSSLLSPTGDDQHSQYGLAQRQAGLRGLDNGFLEHGSQGWSHGPVMQPGLPSLPLPERAPAIPTSTVREVPGAPVTSTGGPRKRIRHSRLKETAIHRAPDENEDSTRTQSDSQIQDIDASQAATGSRNTTQKETGAARQPHFESRESRIMTDVLLEFVLNGEAPDTSFKQKHFQAAAEAINEALPGRKRDWRSVKNHHHYLKKNYYTPMMAMKELLGISGSGWNEEKSMVELDDDVWEALRDGGTSGREKAACRDRPWALYSDWETMYQGRTATGSAVIRPGGRNARTANVSNTQSDEEADGADINGDASGPEDGSRRGSESRRGSRTGGGANESSNRSGSRRSTAMERQEQLAANSERLATSIEEMNRIQAEILKRDPAVKKIEDVYKKIDQACEVFVVSEDTRDDLEAFLEGHADSRDVFLACPMHKVGRLIGRMLNVPPPFAQAALNR